MFGKKNVKTASANELNAFLGVGTEYRGKLEFVGTVRIDGHFEGEIRTEGTLVLGREASIKGSVTVGQLSSCGTIQGDVVVWEKAVLEKNSVLVGSLKTPQLVMEMGAVLEGDIDMSGSNEDDNKVVTAEFGVSVKSGASKLDGTPKSADANAAG